MRLPGILTMKLANFAGSVVFRLLCPPLSLSLVCCVLVFGGLDMGIVAVLLIRTKWGSVWASSDIRSEVAGVLFEELHLCLEWVEGGG